jgi:tetratricopeptide (TPR) repeat protein
VSPSTAAASVLVPLAGVAPGSVVRVVLLAGRLSSRQHVAEEIAVQVIKARKRDALRQRAALRRALQPLVERPPQRASLVADLAALLVSLGDPVTAADLCRDGLRRTTGATGHARLNAQLGRALLRADGVAEAVTALRLAVTAEGTAIRPVWRLWLAQALVATGELAAARDVLAGGALLELEPGQQRRAVRVLLDAGAWEEVKHALDSGHVDPQAAARAATLATRAGRASLAMELARTIDDPRARADAILGVARSHLTFDELPAAIAAAREALEIDPRHLQAHSFHVRALQRGGHLSQARAIVREVADRYPEDAGVLRWAVTSAYQLRSWAEAASFVERLWPLDPLSARIAGARIAVRTGDPSAEATYRQLLSERPDDPEVARLGGELHQRRSREAEAYEAFQRALAGLPNDDTVRLACARLAVRLGRDLEALEHLNVLLERRPGDPRLRRLQVRTEARLGRRSNLDHLPQTGSDTVDDQLVFELVSGLLEAGQDAAAARALEQALHERADGEPVVGR